jgi:hypothetical protein
MTNTIAYDKPVANFIDQMSATGHVTLSPNYKKTSVTIHHNAGINTFQQILDGWKTQPSSAHFDVDAEGDVAQYVETDKYAWAVGSTAGNQSSISIEQCNSGIGGNWPVSETTWKASARLAAWLFVHEIGEPPTSSNLHPHHYWSATACPGPYMDGIWSEYLAEVQAQYAVFAGKPTTPPPSEPGQPVPTDLTVDGELGKNTITKWQQVMGTPVDGVISVPSDLVKSVQRELNSKLSGVLVIDGEGIAQNGEKTDTALALQKYLGTPQDGIISSPVSTVVKALQTRLNTGSF